MGMNWWLFVVINAVYNTNGIDERYQRENVEFMYVYRLGQINKNNVKLLHHNSLVGPMTLSMLFSWMLWYKTYLTDNLQIFFVFFLFRS